MKDDDIFRALANSTRRMLLDQLYKSNGLTLGELSESISTSRQAVSKHLNILEKANLIGTIWKGREKLHYLNPAPILEIYKRWMKKYQAHFADELEELKRNLEYPNQKKDG